MRRTCLGLVVVAGLLGSSAAHAQSRTTVGVGTGAVAGALVAGPIGAVIGAVAGGVIGSSSAVARSRGRRTRAYRRPRAAVQAAPPRTYVSKPAPLSAASPSASSTPVARAPASEVTTVRRSDATGSLRAPRAQGGWQDPR